MLWVPTFTSAGPGFAEDTVFVGRMGAVDLVGGWSAVRGVFKNSGTAGDTEVNWWERQRDMAMRSVTGGGLEPPGNDLIVQTASLLVIQHKVVSPNHIHAKDSEVVFLYFHTHTYACTYMQ